MSGTCHAWSSDVSWGFPYYTSPYITTKRRTRECENMGDEAHFYRAPPAKKHPSQFWYSMRRVGWALKEGGMLNGHGHLPGAFISLSRGDLMPPKYPMCASLFKRGKDKIHFLTVGIIVGAQVHVGGFHMGPKEGHRCLLICMCRKLAPGQTGITCYK